MSDGGDDELVPVGEWLAGTGPESDIVLSTRIRLARNIVNFPLKARLTESDEPPLLDHLRRRIVLAGMEREHAYIDLKRQTAIGRLVLVERHLISLEHMNAQGERGVVIDTEGATAVMLNEEDHLRIQVLASGLALDQGLSKAMSLHDELEGVLDFVYHPRFGYLTSCPTNVGTGMRISVMLHLPSLVLTKQIDKVFNAVSKMNLAVRGIYGEGTKALSDLYQISNQVTLGKTPEDLLADLKAVLPRIIAFERDVRRQLFASDRVLMEDKLWRARGVLANARTMTSEEAFELLSLLRMGVHERVFTGLDLETVNQLFMISQPGHLQTLCGGQPLEPPQRDVVRAQRIRELLAG